jgi:hypothetical protein
MPAAISTNMLNFIGTISFISKQKQPMINTINVMIPVDEHPVFVSFEEL